ncbi:MAG: M55 family metallopeptidase [Candidatus Omnitrophica bacterium]|nr:M55 family metallopeptidase [Candidatus Omnitrophota bacterium]
MKFMIRCDVEGVTGVTTYEQAENSIFGKQMLANDLNAAVEGLLSAGEHEIVIYDEHTDGRNVLLDNLPECASVICGKPLYRPDWGGIDSSYDAMLMIGFHSRSGVNGALLAHSYLRENLNISINGKVVGEIGMEAAIAGDFSVPVWLVAGDSAGMAEAEEILPGVKTVTVKESMGEFVARCYSPKLTAKLICESSRCVAQSPPGVKPLKFNGNIELQISLAESDYLDKLKSRYSKFFIRENTVMLNGRTVTEVWSRYCQIQGEVKKQK